MYVLLFETTSESVDGYAALYILDEHTRVKQKSTLHFLSRLGEFTFRVVKMGINKHNIYIVVASLLVRGDHYAYICRKRDN